MTAAEHSPAAGTAVEPKAGDKVVYDGDSTAGWWRRRRTEPAIVLDVGDMDGHRLCMAWSSREEDAWSAAVHSVRVVERATYEPVGGPG